MYHHTVHHIVYHTSYHMPYTIPHSMSYIISYHIIYLVWSQQQSLLTYRCYNGTQAKTPVYCFIFTVYITVKKILNNLSVRIFFPHIPDSVSLLDLFFLWRETKAVFIYCTCVFLSDAHLVTVRVPHLCYSSCFMTDRFLSDGSAGADLSSVSHTQNLYLSPHGQCSNLFAQHLLDVALNWHSVTCRCVTQGYCCDSFPKASIGYQLRCLTTIYYNSSLL